MAETLADHHMRIRAGIAEIRGHCGRTSPDVASLTSARLRLSQASSLRSRYVRQNLSSLEGTADDRLRAEMSALQRAFEVKRQKLSEHVTTWNSTTIIENWNGYRKAAGLVLSLMEEQMERERGLFERLR